jgi:glycosyltransferase involved in cell wall biosynthesis
MLAPREVVTRLLAVIDSFGIGGAETQLGQVLSLLVDSRGYDCLACSLLQPLPDEVAFSTQVQRVYLHKKSRFSIPSVTLALIEQLRRFKPDIAYSRLPLANALTRIATLLPGHRIPHVAGVDTVPDMYTFRYTVNHPGSLLFRWLERHATQIICNSQGTSAAAVARGYPAARVRVIPNGIDVHIFQPPVSRSAAHRPQLVCVASLRPEKGLVRLLEVLAPALRARRVDLTIAGDGTERPRVELAVSELGLAQSVTLLGVRKDISAVLHNADLFVSAAYIEGFGIAVAEAAATGLPTVAFAAPGGLAEVIVDGVTGHLVPASRPDLFSQRVDELCADSHLRAKMGAAAREHIVSHFALNTVVDALERSFMSCGE